MTGKRKTLIARLTFVSTLGGLLFGYDTAVISGAVTSIDAYFIDPQGLAETARNNLSGFTISSALLGCILGAMLAGWSAQRLGRKGGMMLAASLFLVSSLGAAWPEFGLGTIGAMGPAALPAFIANRILAGVGVGIASMLSPLYIAEIAPSAIRGRLVSLNQLAIIGGMVVVYFVNYYIASQGDDTWINDLGWRYMLGSCAVPALAFLVFLCFVPDTPRYLVYKGRDEEALAVLNNLTDPADASRTFSDIKRSLEVKSAPLFSFGSRLIIVGILLSVFQQFVGINAVLYYAPLMFKNMGASTNSAFLQTVVVGIANVAFTLVAVATVDRWGRKPLLIAGGIIMGVSMIALGILFQTHTVGAAALGAVIAYIAGFALSWGPVVWVLLVEIFPNSIKGKALTIAVGAQWIANLFVSWTFKILDGSSALNAMFNHGFAYWIYGAMSLLAAAFVFKYVPETRGRALEGMEELWKPRRLLPDIRNPG